MDSSLFARQLPIHAGQGTAKRLQGTQRVSQVQREFRLRYSSELKNYVIGIVGVDDLKVFDRRFCHAPAKVEHETLGIFVPCRRFILHSYQMGRCC